MITSVNIDQSVACENPVSIGYWLPHDWRLIDEEPDHEVEKLDGGDYRTHATVRRRWYCTRCRKIETTSVRDP